MPFPAGSSADSQSRVIADELSKKVGKPVVIENKPGTGGNFAATEAARSTAEGTTLYMATTGKHAITVSLYAKLQSGIWAALYTTSGTPKPIVDKLSRELAAIMDSPVFKAKFEAQDFEVRSSSRDELAVFAASETKRWGDIIQALDINLN